ncbi:MAG: DNA methyltransferase [Gammaproteobacteria bacterium]|nr:DNA methyltransferase [Gammaproteobacteria bacterium]
MGRWEADTVDLIYLDPPFNSNASYNVLYADHGAGKAQYRAFDDTWAWNEAAQARLETYESAVARSAHKAVVGLAAMLGHSGMLAYLTYMAERLEQCHRLLKPTGSIYLHCDPTASHGLKLLMDAIFGSANFRSEIIWKRTSAHGDTKQGRKQHGRIHDVLLFYTKTDDWAWNPVYTDYDPSYVKSFYRHVEEGTGRRYRLDNLTGPGGAAKGNPEYEVMGVRRYWRYSKERMRSLIREGRVVQTKPGNVPQYKRYLDEMPGVPLQDIWTDIPPVSPQAKERLGYPTQKPVKLLERIIRASSNEDDFVLDPFCGCGTTVDAANRLRRRWSGIDISSFAVDLIRKRRMADQDIVVKGIPYSLRAARKLAAANPFSFESWAVMRLPGFTPNTAQVADRGVDGRASLATPPSDGGSRLALAQVKGGKFSLSQLRDFIHVIGREQAAFGIYVTLDPVKSRNAIAEAASAGMVAVGAERYPRCQLWSLAQHFEGHGPRLPTMNDPYTGKPMWQPDLWPS